MEYNFSQDLKSIRKILGLSQGELAGILGVEQVTISRNESCRNMPSKKLMESLYSFAFENGIQINRLKEMLWLESLKNGHKLLFHGAKSLLDGPLDIYAGRPDNDFGRGFYTGESYLQAISFVSSFDNSSVYLLDFEPGNLKCKKYGVDQEWMMTIAYYRETLNAYREHPLIKQLVAQSRDCDYIIAPIADNRMFQIIDSFISGEITDEQCRHCLSATNLGLQYVFINENSIKNVNPVERCYISSNERAYYRNVRSSESRLGDDKVKLARIKYRGQGHYIDEILK